MTTSSPTPFEPKPATASGHLGKLMAAELLVCEQRGRHRYYRLADDEVAHALEAIALIAERRTHTAAWANNPTRQRLRFARCCYGHLAGKLPKALLALADEGSIKLHTSRLNPWFVNTEPWRSFA